jgi:hypothetical protein
MRREHGTTAQLNKLDENNNTVCTWSDANIDIIYL